MKFIIWLLDIPWRHHKEAMRYNRGGIATRILAMIFLTAFVGGSIYLEYLGFDMAKNNEAIGYLLIVLSIIMILAAVEMLGVYSYFGFKTAISGSMSAWIEKMNRKRGKTQTVVDAQVESAQPDEVQPIKRKCPKWLDIFVGVYFALLAIASILLALFVATGTSL